MGKPVRNDPKRSIRAPRGTELSCKSWLTEAPMRMLMNNLDPDVAEKPVSPESSATPTPSASPSPTAGS